MISTNPWINLWNESQYDSYSLQEFTDFLEQTEPQIYGVSIAPSNIARMKYELDRRGLAHIYMNSYWNPEVTVNKVRK